MLLFNCSYMIADPALLLGHLKFIKTLFACEGVDKRAIGKQYVLKGPLNPENFFRAFHAN